MPLDRMNMAGLSVNMFVYNNCDKDARVLKEAATLVESGYTVKIYAVQDEQTPVFEIRNGIEIIRVPKDPLHYRLMRRQIMAVISPKKLPALAELRSKFHANTNQHESTASHESKISRTEVVAKKEIGKFKESLKRVFDTFVKVPLMLIHRPLCYYDFYRKTRPYCAEEHADIYHAHDLNALLPAAKAAKKFNGKLVYDSHELYTHRNKPVKSSSFYRYLTELFERKHIRKADSVITVSESIADYLKDKYKINRPIVIMNAPSKTIEYAGGKSLRDELNVPDNLKLAIYCGSITFNRGLEKLVESLTLLPNVYLVMMGYGAPDLLSNLQKIANNNKVDDRFSFYGPVQPHEVTSYTSSADVGVAPIQNACLSYYFCAPNKVFEYIVGGIPVVASNFPDLSKIVSENEIGYVFDPEDISSIANSISKIFEDSEHYQLMKQNTVVAKNKYNWEIEERKLIELYSSLSKS